MDKLKLRKTLIMLHLLFAGFMAPAFVLLAITGGAYLLDNKGQETKAAIELPAGTVIDLKSSTAEDDIRALLASANIDHDFEYLKNRGTTAQTRPTSRPYISFKQKDGQWMAEKVTPNLMKAAIEIHKGHGPKLLKTYHKIVALLLIGVVFGGILVGLLAKAYRRQTIGAVAVGSLIYIALIFLA